MTPVPASSLELPGIALVVFSGETDLGWLKILKPGFRHCFALLENHGRWVLFNPLSHKTEITLIEGNVVFDLVGLFRNKGMKVVPWVIDPVGFKAAPLAPYTCVEAIKRILGIHSPFIITPWKLYIFLKNKKIRLKPLTTEKILLN
ncbi:MAG: hypothetical protein HQ512_07795 [Rhodospirillales bacterium]|nr:hypothetical protein [Rhodospirillales bacterium]